MTHAARWLRPSDRAYTDDIDAEIEPAEVPRAIGRWTQVDVRDGRADRARRGVPGRTTRVLAEHAEDDELTSVARAGVADRGVALPYLAELQRAFGPAHDLSAIEAHIGGAAATATTRIGADAYAFGNHIAFAASPALRLAAHEVAHVVQQRAGLVRGPGRAGDDHERHADVVAAHVVAGLSVAHLFGGGGGLARPAVQCQLLGAAPISSVDPDGSTASPTPEQRARHDGSATSELGDGDNVFDEQGNVIVVFPATPEGVVEAALYELHRGDTRSLDDIRRDDTAGRTRRGTHAAIEVITGHSGNDSDPADARTIGRRRVGGEMRDLGPITAYQQSAGIRRPHAWCGAFATFVYLRCGLLQPGDTLATACSVPDVLGGLRDGEQRSTYYHVTGGPTGDQRHRRFSGQLETGRSTGHGFRDARGVTAGTEIDIRPGDTFWLENPTEAGQPRTGHVGIIIGVHRAPELITLITIEGNSRQMVTSRTRLIRIANGQVVSDIKGWGRPPALAAEAAPTDTDGDMPAWMPAAEENQRGDDGSTR